VKKSDVVPMHCQIINYYKRF